MTFHTRLPIEECKVRLAASIDEERLAFSWSGHAGSKPILGKIRDSTFRLQKRRFYKNSFAPYFYGRFVAAGRETQIEQGRSRGDGRMSASHTPRLAALCIALAALGCEAPTASINDVAGGRATILTVDGQPVKRAGSKYVTMVPVALVVPGPHSFSVRKEAGLGSLAETLTVSATVAAGKKYRFEERDGAVQLVEESDRTAAAVQWRGYSLEEVRSLAELPATIKTALGVDLPGADGVADRGGRFHVTDVVLYNAPFRRFLAAGRQGDTWLVALEHGGRAYYVEVFLFTGSGSTPKEKWVLDRPKTLSEVVEQLPKGPNAKGARAGGGSR